MNTERSGISLGITVVTEADLEFVIEHIADRADIFREDVLVVPVEALRDLIKQHKDKPHGT